MVTFRCVLFMVLLATVASAQVDQVVQTHVESGLLHGTVLVADRGEIVHESACGLADAAWDQPNDLDTRFKIYSMTKQFTAVLVLQQAAAGKLRLDDTVSEHLPWFDEELGDRITIHQLLCHTSGIQEAPRSQMPMFVEGLPDESIPQYLSAGLGFEPGSQFEYSGLAGFTILAAILEAVTVQTYDSLLRDRILDSLGMADTVYLDYQKLVPNKAEDYRRDDDAYRYRLQPYFIWANGASSLVTTARDLLKWDRGLRDETLLPTAWRDLLFTPHIEVPNGAYGYGFYLWTENRTDPPRHFAYHAGGGSCGMVMDLDRDLTVVMLNNVLAPNVIGACFDVIGAMD